VDLVVHEVVQLQHVDVADGDRLVEGLTGAAVVEHGLAALRQPGRGFRASFDLLDLGAVEDRRLRLEAELLTPAAQPRCVSRIWPRFMRLGTPSGLSTMSTGVPSARKGMSSSGMIFETTPLLPWRPAILSPT
jgi:hypothetical protein